MLAGEASGPERLSGGACRAPAPHRARRDLRGARAAEALELPEQRGGDRVAFA